MTFRLRLIVTALLAAAAFLPAYAGTITGHVYSPALRSGEAFVITIDDIEGSFPPPRHPVVMDQRGLRFAPHVLAIVRGATVEFPNNDPLLHNVFSISPAKRFNLGLYGKGAVRRLRFDNAGVVELLCNVHQEMTGYIVVAKNPYFAVTSDGNFRIDKVPAGKHVLRCWHERLGEQSISVDVPASGAVTADFRMDETASK